MIFRFPPWFLLIYVAHSYDVISHSFQTGEVLSCIISLHKKLFHILSFCVYLFKLHLCTIILWIEDYSSVICPTSWTPGCTREMFILVFYCFAHEELHHKQFSKYSSEHTIFCPMLSLESLLEIMDLHWGQNESENILSHAYYNVMSHAYTE